MTQYTEDVVLNHGAKYTYRYHIPPSEMAGTVEILRHNQSWLVNPEGTKAWIDAANTIQELRNAVAQLETENAQLSSELNIAQQRLTDPPF